MFLKAEKRYPAHGLADRSEKPGEEMCKGFVPDLQRIAATKAEPRTIAESPQPEL